MVPLSIKLEFWFCFGFWNKSLSGTIPTEIGNLTNMVDLRWSFNLLTGTIRSQIVHLPSLTTLYYDSNSLSGTIPTEIGNLTNMADRSGMVFQHVDDWNHSIFFFKIEIVDT